MSSSDEDNVAALISSGDDEDVSSSEEESTYTKKRKKRSSKKSSKKRRTVNQFIEVEADDDDDEDDDDDDDHHLEDMYEDERDDAEREAAKAYDASHKRYDQQRQAQDAESAEEIVHRIKRRHQQSQRRYDDDDGLDGTGGHGTAHSAVTQQSLLPSVKDPKLWIFKCKPGREAQAILSLMNKYIAMANTSNPIQITSAVASSTKGFIYIEAEREPHAKAAVQGLRDISHWSMKLVPIQEMSAVLSIKSRKKPLVAGTWARIKRVGLYKGDLCKVLEVLDSSTRALVKLVPRLDPVLLASGGGSHRKNGQRPPPKLLSTATTVGADLARKRHPLTGEMMDVLDGEYYLNGFLMKEVNITTMLDTTDVVPTLEENQRFSGSNGGGNDNSATVDDSSWSKQVELVKGDTVRVIDGDLCNLMGIVVSISSGSDLVRVMPLHEEIRDTILDFQRKQLMKFVKVGDHVKVICGRYVGETGTVVSVDESDGAPFAIVLADSMAKEIQVRVRDLQESAEVSTGLDSLKGKQLYDLVQLSHGDVGVITHIGRDTFKVLTNAGQTSEITDQEIQRKLQSNRSAALDNQKNHIAPGEMVSVIDGTYAGQTGTIKHLYRSFVFLHNNKISTNSGIFVVKARNVVLAGSKARSNLTQNSMVDPKSRNSNHHRNNHRNNNREDSDMMGKTVKIKKGRHKGYLGMVVEENENKVKVEIHSKSATVEVDRMHIMIVGSRSGQIQDHPLGGATPMVGATPMAGATPLHSGSMTPMHTGTPLHPSGSATPQAHTPGAGDVWNPSSTAPLDSSSHPETPYGGAGHHHYGTPMMDAVATPAGTSGGIATPGYNYGTPGGNAYSPAPDQNPYSHPVTPGMPGSSGAVGTPGLYPQTPMMPNTPSGLGAPGSTGAMPPPITPGMEASSSSPMPATPFGMDGGDPHAVDDVHPQHAAAWATAGIEVSVKSGEHEGEMCVIQAIQPNGMCVVSGPKGLFNSGSDVLVPVVPEKHDRVKVLSGAEAGQTGVLIGKDGDDGIAKMDETAEITIYSLSALGKLRK